MTRSQEFKKRLPTAPLRLLQVNKRRRTPQVTNNFAVRTPPRQLKQTRFSWPFNSWQATETPPTSTKTSTGFQNCPNLSKQQGQPTSDGKSEKFEIFEDLLQTSLKIRNQLTKEY